MKPSKIWLTKYSSSNTPNLLNFIKMNLGLTIKKLRKQKEINQISFAEKCGITQTYLSQIENNAKEPTITKLKMISDALDIPLPIIFFLSMDESDIQPNKRSTFKLIKPSVNSMLYEF